MATGAPTRMASIQAKPHMFALDVSTAAVIVVDMQNDFGSIGGMFHRAGIDLAGIRRAVESTRRVLAAARRNGIPVIYPKSGSYPLLIGG